MTKKELAMIDALRLERDQLDKENVKLREKSRLMARALSQYAHINQWDGCTRLSAYATDFQCPGHGWEIAKRALVDAGIKAQV